MNEERVKAKQAKLTEAQGNILSFCEKIAKVQVVTEAAALGLAEATRSFLTALADFENAVDMKNKNERSR